MAGKGRRELNRDNLDRPETAKPKAREAGGSYSDAFNHRVIMGAIGSQWLEDIETHEETVDAANAALAPLISLEPENEIEAMLIAQMIALHAQAMECFRRAMIAGQTFAGREVALKYGVRCSDAYRRLYDTFNKQRGRVQQTVRVEHVHVHEGGQAIVGNVTPGEGGLRKEKEQSHATLGDARQPAMRGLCENDREAVPQRCDG